MLVNAVAIFHHAATVVLRDLFKVGVVEVGLVQYVLVLAVNVLEGIVCIQ